MSGSAMTALLTLITSTNSATQTTAIASSAVGRRARVDGRLTPSLVPAIARFAGARRSSAACDGRRLELHDRRAEVLEPDAAIEVGAHLGGAKPGRARAQLEARAGRHAREGVAEP